MDYSSLNVGVLALQGAVAEHLKQIESLGATGVAIKHVEELNNIDALIIPGGESTAIGRLMRLYGFIDGIQAFAKSGKPIFGTCAGMIVLAKNIVGGEASHLNLIDVTVQRNAFGRQIDSFQADLEIKGLDEVYPAIFIRAPFIDSIDSEKVEVLSEINGHAVLAKQNNIMICSFHPELSNDNRITALFLEHLVF